jgi:serine phosphatase RsbU (regulator of sigma subunit)/anti-sigma regulatory factor (Ser/Thr protein kinase)
MAGISIQPDPGASCRVAFARTLPDAREASRALRVFLEGTGLDESELFACELCLAEACANAIQHDREAASAEPLQAEAVCTPGAVELRVLDHTSGFELPVELHAPPPEQEHGRGIFIIRSLMDDVRYFKGGDTNMLVMRKARIRHHHPAVPHDAKRQLEECREVINGMARELCFRSESLSAIFRCCAELGRTRDLEGFVQRLLGDLLHLTSADWFVLRLASSNSDPLAVFAASSPELHTGPLSLPEQAGEGGPAEITAALTRTATPIRPNGPGSDDEPLRAAGTGASGIVLPLLFGEALVGTLAVGRRGSDDAFSGLQSEVIRTFAEFLAIQIVSARHQEEQVSARLAEHELVIARDIQRALLPRLLPRFGRFSLAGSCESARQVGGDFYDVLPLTDDSLLLVVADVMGKGLPAAMFATITHSLVRAMSGSHFQPALLLEQINRILHKDLSEVGMFITAQVVFIDFRRHRLLAASAGHCPVLLVPEKGGEPICLPATGIPLGVLPSATYHQQNLAWENPRGLLLYTDGLTEMCNPEGEMFGQKRLEEWLRANLRFSSSAEALRERLCEELHTFRAGAPLRDDQAFLILTGDRVSRPHPETERTDLAGAASSSTHP